jgi:uncharacterized protein
MSAEATITPDMTATAAATSAAPIGASGASRIGSLDFIRGLAVMGILAANIVAFGQPFDAYMYPDGFLVPHSEAEDWMWVAQFVLIDGKMRGLFTLLFGAGLYLFMEKAWARGHGRWLQARRLFWLLLFGLAHFYLIWRGDILTCYAVFGLVALAAMRWAAKTQLIAGLLGYAVGAIMIGGFAASPYMVAETEFGDQAAYAEMREQLAADKAEALADGQAEHRIITQGSYGDYVRHNLSEHAGDPLFGLFLFSLETLPLMLIGMALYRFGLFSGGIDPGRLLRWGAVGIVIGSVLTLMIGLWVKSIGFSYWGTLAAFMSFSFIPRLPVVLGLAAVLAVVGSRASGWLAERISAAGRAAFTNYLGTSLVMLLVFHGWAGGVFGALGRTELYLVMLGAWALMLLWSKPWLERYRFGPLEWLWRCLTYQKLFPLRRPPSV